MHASGQRPTRRRRQRLRGAHPPRAAALAAAALAGLAVAGCGGGEEEDPNTLSGDDRAQIEEAAIAYGASEGGEACEYLSAGALDQLGGESGCTQSFEGVQGFQFEVEDVSLDGDVATASILNADTDDPIELELVDEDGEWRISSFPGIEQLRRSIPAEPEPGAGEEAPPEEEAPPSEEDLFP